MSPRSKQQFEKIREEKRALIMSVAIELFADNGYHNTSVSKIASRAGISKGLLYNYFDNKEDLLKVIIIDGLERLRELLDPNRDGIITKEEMRRFIELTFDMINRDNHFWTLYYSLMLQPSVLGIVRPKIEELLKLYMGMLSKYFEMLGHEDPYTDAMIFGSLMDGIGLNFVANSDPVLFEKLKKRLIQLYCS